MKLKYTLVFSIISFFITATVFSQQLSDQEIGFDVTRTTIMLKEHGVQRQDLAREIGRMREMQIRQYAEMEKMKKSILQKDLAKQGAKATTSQIARTAKTSATDIPLIERQALIVFYNSTGGENWINTKDNNMPWDINNPDSDVSTWYGVKVENGHVVGLGQYSGRGFSFTNNLVGSIPPEIENLKNLQILNLQNNQLTGNIIDTKIGNLTSLIVLDLSKNYFSGNINEIVNLKNLEWLDLDYNKFNGTLPIGIGSLMNLGMLDLHENQLTGDINEVVNLKNLFWLQLGENFFDGNIPTGLGDLTKLTYLDLSVNQLSSYIPIEINKLSLLSTLNLRFNELSGNIPDLTNLTFLKTFYFDRNKFRFIDFAAEFPVYKNHFTTFWYERQAKIDTEKTVIVAPRNSVSLIMCEDNRFTPEDTFQWYKGSYNPGGVLIPGANARVYTLSNATIADAGDYYCLSRHPQITNVAYENGKFTHQDLILERELIHLKVTDCAPISGSIKLLTDKPVQNKNIDFALDTTVPNLSYEWTFYNPDNTVKVTLETPTATILFSEAGLYRVSLTVTDGCQTSTFEKPFIINPCNSIVEGNIKIDQTDIFVDWNTQFSLDTATTTGLTYFWTFYDKNNNEYANYSTPTVVDSFWSAGVYRVNLVVTDEATGCITSFDKIFEVLNDCDSVDRRGNIQGGNTILVNSESSFSFQPWYFSATIDKYDFNWDLIDSNNVIVFSGTGIDFSITPTINGVYKVRLKLKEKDNNCEYEYLFDVKVGDMCVATEGTRNGWINLPYEWNYSKTISYVSINTPAELIFRFSDSYSSWDKNWSYEWKLYDPNRILVSSTNEKDFHFTLSKADYYKLVLVLTDVDTGCSTEHTNIVKGYISGGCTNSNSESEVVKNLYYGLLKSLISRSIYGETDSQINDSTGSAELLALKPYITNGIGNKIYNFKSVRNEDGYVTKIEFSFAPNRDYDVSVFLSDGVPNYFTVDEFNLYIDGYIYTDIQDYTTSYEYTVYCSGATENAENNDLKNVNCSRETKIRYIDFCPTPCTPITGVIKMGSE